MGNIELPGAATGSKQALKVPVGTYEFGANLISEKGVRVCVAVVGSLHACAGAHVSALLMASAAGSSCVCSC
jgi:hypothetical protein